MAGRAFKGCVEKKRCPNERCKHEFALDYTPDGGERCKMQIIKAFGVSCLSRLKAEQIYLPDFIKEVNLAQHEGRKPFAHRQVMLTTFADLMSKFLKDVREVDELDHIHASSLRSKYRFLLSEFGKLPIVRLSGKAGAALLREARAAWKADGKKGVGGRNGMLTELRVMLNWAVGEGVLAEPPFGKGKSKIQLERPRPRDRRLLEGEEAQLLAAAATMNTAPFNFSGERMHDRIVFSIDMGARLMEMMHCQRGDIDFTNEVVTFPASKLRRVFDRKTKKWVVREEWNTKGRKTRSLAMTARVKALLLKFKDKPADYYLFGEEGRFINKFDTSWNTLNLMAHGYPHIRDSSHGRPAEQKAAMKAIGLTYHTLRHEAISRWADEGEMSETDIMAAAGHASFTTTLGYINRSKTKLFAAMRATEAKRLAS